MLLTLSSKPSSRVSVSGKYDYSFLVVLVYMIMNYLVDFNNSYCYSFSIPSKGLVVNPTLSYKITSTSVHNYYHHCIGVLFAFPNSSTGSNSSTNTHKSSNNNLNNNSSSGISSTNSKHHKRDNHTIHTKKYNSHYKKQRMKRNYKQTTTEDDEDDYIVDTNFGTTDTTTTSSDNSNRRTFSTRNKNMNKNSNNDNRNDAKNHSARKRYQQQRRQQRSNKQIETKSMIMTTTINNNTKNKKNKRPIKKTIDIDLSKPFFTYHTILPPLEQSQNIGSTTQNNSNMLITNNENNLDNSHTQSSSPSLKHVISPSVLEQNEQNCVPYICGPLPTIYTNDPHTVHQWLCDNIITTNSNTHSFIGFDVEAVSNVPWRKERINAHDFSFSKRPATVQLSTPYSSLVLQLTSNYDHGDIGKRSSRSSSDKLLYPLQALLNDPSIIKVGAGIDDDMLELYRWNNSLQAQSRFDIGGIGSSNQSGNRVSLQRLVRAIVGVELAKSKRVIMSDWSQVPLTMKQLNYASRDAWAGAAVMENLGFMYEEYMNVDFIGNMLRDVEREMIDLDIRARERKKAKGRLKAIMKQMRQYDNDDNNDYITYGYDGGDFWPVVLKQERDRLKQIVDDTAPDGLIFFPQELLGLDFSFEELS